MFYLLLTNNQPVRFRVSVLCRFIDKKMFLLLIVVIEITLANVCNIHCVYVLR